VAALEVNRHDLIPARQFKRRCLSQLGEQAYIPKSLRQNRCGSCARLRVGLLRSSACDLTYAHVMCGIIGFS